MTRDEVGKLRVVAGGREKSRTWCHQLDLHLEGFQLHERRRAASAHRVFIFRVEKSVGAEKRVRDIADLSVGYIGQGERGMYAASRGGRWARERARRGLRRR